MAAGQEERVRVVEAGDVPRARRAARTLAAAAGFGSAEAAEVETVASELATNLVKHAWGGGEIAVLVRAEGGRGGIEVRAVDGGPGIADVERALVGGHSTRGTLGIGLSGVKRLMDDFALRTGPGAGTEVTACKWLDRQAAPLVRFSVLASPMPGEALSGDAYFIRRFPDVELFGVLDVLGHGPEAHQVALRCLELLEAHCREDLGAIIGACHRGLRHTRGAALALARVDRATTSLEHVSVGNVETRVFHTPRPVRPFCFNGTLGMALESSRPSTYPLAPGAVVVMYSDGLDSRFDVPAHPLGETPQRIAEAIFAGHVRGTDDATLLVGKVSA